MGDSGRFCLKCLLLVFNIIYLIFGIVIIAVGGLCLHVINANYKDLVGNSFTISCVVFLILGILSFLAGVFGCCGALRESRCCLVMYAVCIVVLVLVALTIGIVMLAFGSLLTNFSKSVSTSLTDAIVNYNPDSEAASTMDNLQHEIHCCGIRGPFDWKNATQLPKGSVPDSCCRQNTEGCGKNAIQGNTIDDDEYYPKGCFVVVEEFITTYSAYVGGICFGIGLLEILGIIISCCLICTIRESYSV